MSGKIKLTVSRVSWSPLYFDTSLQRVSFHRILEPPLVRQALMVYDRCTKPWRILLEFVNIGSLWPHCWCLADWPGSEWPKVAARSAGWCIQSVRICLNFMYLFYLFFSSKLIIHYKITVWQSMYIFCAKYVNEMFVISHNWVKNKASAQ